MLATVTEQHSLAPIGQSHGLSEHIENLQNIYSVQL